MYWPLIAGFIAVVLLTLLIGWLVDSSRQRNANRH
jgi:F0F1-type ATP synthase assembly protein I